MCKYVFTYLPFFLFIYYLLVPESQFRKGKDFVLFIAVSQTLRAYASYVVEIQ